MENMGESDGKRHSNVIYTEELKDLQNVKRQFAKALVKTGDAYAKNVTKSKHIHKYSECQ